MKISNSYVKFIKFSFIAAFLIIACPLQENGQPIGSSSIDMFHFSGRTLTCGIDLGDDMKGGHGLESGFAYEMLHDFARDHNCTVKIVINHKNADYTDSLKAGTIDLLIMHHEDAAGKDGILLSKNINDCTAMAVIGDQKGHMREINEWLDTYTASEEYEEMKKLFFRPFNPIKREEKGIMAETVSPYDDLIKKYADELGWDWRMLAAVVYQESKFSISSRSHRGASGLMQVMPQTAEYYDIFDLTDPQQNLIAGTNHLKRLQSLYQGCDMSADERINFTLAAYNAGEGRIRDCRNLAKSEKLDENVWSDIVSVIPMMNEESILLNENVKLGKFKGTETIAYVDNVRTLYESICKISPR